MAEQEVYQMETAGERLDKFLAARLTELSRSHLQKLIEAGAVLVDGKPRKASGVVRGASCRKAS